MTTLKYSIHRFNGAYDFLSNFYPQPVMYEDVWYMTVEHAYQAAKTEDLDQRRQIELALHPGDAKALGRNVPLRANWEALRVDIMRGLLEQKFAHGTMLAQRLMETYPHKLIEGNAWGDTFWGVCQGIGENQLGKLLMEQRAVLQARE